MTYSNSFFLPPARIPFTWASYGVGEDAERLTVDRNGEGSDEGCQEGPDQSPASHFGRYGTDQGCAVPRGLPVGSMPTGRGSA